VTLHEIHNSRLFFKAVRFQIMSDLHLESFQDYSTFRIPSSAPYLILAGDVGHLSAYHAYRTWASLARIVIYLQKSF
jgi:hypothetical protein